MALRDSGFARDENDWYIEPAWTVDELARSERIPAGSIIYDPACGRGTVLDAMRARGCKTMGSDIVNRDPDHAFQQFDFLTSECATQIGPSVDWIITNPPFKHALEFIQRARIISANCAFLVPLTFLASRGRYDLLFEATPPTRTIVLSNRPSMPPGHIVEQGGKIGSGSTDFCWLVWRKQAMSAPQIGWLIKPKKAEAA